MADVSHDLRSLRYLVESPLSSKVAMFNNQVQQHQKAQLLNPFSQVDGRSSPKPTFSKDEYGKPLAGSLTEMRGNKANIHVLKEMLELCQIIDTEGYIVNDEPNMRFIPFGELFNIYNYISDKVVGILLRARKHKLVEFEGEMLFQRRDDHIPIVLLKPIAEIRAELEKKVEVIKRASSLVPQPTTILLDRRNKNLDDSKEGTSILSSFLPASPVLTTKNCTLYESTQTASKELSTNNSSNNLNGDIQTYIETDSPSEKFDMEFSVPLNQCSVEMTNIINHNCNDNNTSDSLNLPLVEAEKKQILNVSTCESLNINETNVSTDINNNN